MTEYTTTKFKRDKSLKFEFLNLDNLDNWQVSPRNVTRRHPLGFEMPQIEIRGLMARTGFTNISKET